MTPTHTCTHTCATYNPPTTAEVFAAATAYERARKSGLDSSKEEFEYFEILRQYKEAGYR